MMELRIGLEVSIRLSTKVDVIVLPDLGTKRLDCLEIRQRGNKMNKFELFTMIFFVLDGYWDDHKSDDLGQFLSSMNPFLFEDIGSAVPDIYNDFCKMLGNRSITIDNSFAIAKEYISSFGADYISEAFGWMDEEKWKASCNEYLSEPHKGDSE